MHYIISKAFSYENKPTIASKKLNKSQLAKRLVLTAAFDASSEDKATSSKSRHM